MTLVKNRIFWGLLAGIIGGLAGVFILWGSWLLPSLGLLLTRADIVNGASALLILGVIGGIIYALVVGERKCDCIILFFQACFWRAFWFLGS